MNTFEENESGYHEGAKLRLAKWLEEAEACCASHSDVAELAQLKWRPNYGIHTELRFCSLDNPYYFENRESKPDRKDWGQILFVPDIVVFEKGTPAMIFEVVWSNKVSFDKFIRMRNFFSSVLMPVVYEIRAEDILRYKRKPKELLIRQLDAPFLLRRKLHESMTNCPAGHPVHRVYKGGESPEYSCDICKHTWAVPNYEGV